jgi:UDP-glucose 4-epimerase
MFGLNFVIFRPHNVYGEFQNIGDKYRNVVGIFMNQLMQGKELTVFGDGQQTRAFSYIRDISTVIANSVNVKGAYNNVFNIGADQECTVKELALATIEAMGIPGELKYLPARNEVVFAYADHSKAREYFGSNGATGLAEGLKRMADWAKTVGVTSSQKFSNIEIVEKVPEVWIEN